MMGNFHAYVKQIMWKTRKLALSKAEWTKEYSAQWNTKKMWTIHVTTKNSITPKLEYLYYKIFVKLYVFRTRKLYLHFHLNSRVFFYVGYWVLKKSVWPLTSTQNSNIRTLFWLNRGTSKFSCPARTLKNEYNDRRVKIRA